MTAAIGTPVHQLPTPALVVEIDAMERNLHRMARYCEQAGVQLRPHIKAHRSADLARRQLAAGAHGLCCGSLADAEVMLAAGLDNLLITRELARPAELARAAELARQWRLLVLVDDEQLVERLDAAARHAGSVVDVLVDVDLGLDRSGVAPFEPALRLAGRVDAARSLRFCGLMGYEGSMAQLDAPARAQACERALGDLLATRHNIEGAGIAVPIVSCGATATFRTAGTLAGISEIQPGSYLLGDGKYRHITPEFENALTVLTTVVSRPRSGRVTVDAGQKKLTALAALPLAVDPALRMVKVQEEHGLLDLADAGRVVNIGDRVELIPWLGGPTINLYDTIYGVRGGVVAEVWPIAARGA